MKIAAILTVYNDEAFLPQFLDYYSAQVDTIFAIDNESDDRSIEILKRYPKVELSVYQTGGRFNHERKNEVLNEKAKSCVGSFDYTLVLDVDEFIVPKKLGPIRTALEANPSRPAFGTSGNRGWTVAVADPQVAGYLAALESMEEHAEPVKLSQVLAIHHWMAISAITAGDPNDALHHVGHIIERVKGEHLETMEKARALLRQGDLHEAEHLIEEMLAGKAKPELTLAELNLRLALTAVDQRDRAEAIHQIRHYLERVRGAEREKGEAVLAHLREGDLHGAEHGIADLLGIEGD